MAREASLAELPAAWLPVFGPCGEGRIRLYFAGAFTRGPKSVEAAGINPSGLNAYHNLKLLQMGSRGYGLVQ